MPDGFGHGAVPQVVPSGGAQTSEDPTNVAGAAVRGTPAEPLPQESSQAGTRPRREPLPSDLFQGSDVQKTVRRAGQWELTEEIDPRSNFVAHGRLLAYAPVSLHFFDESSTFRQFLVWLVTWAWWDRIILVAILLNSLALACTDYSITAVDLATLQPSGDNSPVNAFIEATEPIFTAIFTVECVCKIVAMGFVMDHGSYLRDSWHIIDFAVVITSLLKLLPGMPNVSALRAFRVLRPLRTLSRVRGMRMMVKSLLSSLPALGNVAVLVGFTFVLYAIFGLNIFMGVTRARCRLTPYPISIPASHMQTWNAPVPGNVQLSQLPWVTAGQFQGFSPSDVNALSGNAGGRNSSLLQLLNATSFSAGSRQPLYFEAVGRYFTANEPEESLYEAAVVNQEYYQDNPVGDVPWELDVQYWMPFPAAANYVWQMVNNRTAFPYCDAGQAINPSAGGAAWPDTGIPLDRSDWNQQTSPWREARMCVWVINDDNSDTCSLSGGGLNQCVLDVALLDDESLPTHVAAGSQTANTTLSLRFAPQTCGSNYDQFGNARFSNSRFMASESNNDELENGVVSFDNIGAAFLLVYQSLLQQGWSVIMAWYMDSFALPWVAALLFVSFNLIGALFLLNLVIAAIFIEFTAAQMQEQEQLRIRKEKVAAIQAAEKEEQRRAVNKARTVIQVRTKGLFIKTYALKRVSATAAELGLGPGATEACLDIQKMYDLCLDPEKEVDLEPRLPREVRLRRQEEAEAAAAEAEEDAALAAVVARGSDAASVAGDESAALLSGAPESADKLQQAVFHGILRQRLERLAENGQDGGTDGNKSTGADSSRSGKSASTASRAASLLASAAGGLKGYFGSKSSGRQKSAAAGGTTGSVAFDASATTRDTSGSAAFSGTSRPATNRVGFWGGNTGNGSGLGTTVVSTPHGPKDGVSGDASPPVASPTGRQASVISSDTPAGSGRLAFFSRVPLAQPVATGSARQPTKSGDGGSVAMTDNSEDNFTVATGKTGKSDGFSTLFFGGRKKKASGSDSVSEGMSVGGGSEGLPSQITDEWADGSVGSFNSMDSGLARSANRRFVMPSRAPLKVRARYYLLQFVSSGTFSLFMMTLIILNMVTMSMDSYPSEASTTHALEFLNAVLTLAFAVEMILRLTALGPSAYARDRMNLFDAMVVFVSLIDLAVAPPYLWTGEETRSTAVLALRTLRLARVFKLARSWVSLRVLIKTIFSAAKDIAYFSILLVLFLFIFGLLGIQLFANRWRFSPFDGSPLTPDEPAYFASDVYIPRSNYDSTWYAMLSVFQLLTLDDWPSQLINAYKVEGILGVLFMVSATVVGAIVMVSLFLAVILASFEGLNDPSVKAAHDALVQADLAEAAGGGNDDEDAEYHEQLRLQRLEMEEEQKYEAAMAAARADLSTAQAASARGMASARGSARGPALASNREGGALASSRTGGTPGAASGAGVGTARSGVGTARSGVVGSGGSVIGGARVSGRPQPPLSTAVFSSQAVDGLPGAIPGPTPAPRPMGSRGTVMTSGTRKVAPAPPPRPPSKLRLFYLRIIAVAQVRAAAFQAVISGMRDPNGLRVLIEFRRRIRRQYASRRKVPGSGGRNSGSVRISSNGSVMSGGSSVAGGSVYTDGAGSAYSGTTMQSRAASTAGKGGGGSGDGAVAIGVAGGSARDQQPNTAKQAAVAAANKLWAAGTTNVDSTPASSPAMTTMSNAAEEQGHHPHFNDQPAAAVMPGVVAGAPGGRRLSAAERYQRDITEFREPEEGDDGGSADSSDHRTWFDRLSSLSDGSISTHGRGTVGSDDQSNKDEDEDEEDDDGEESDGNHSSQSGSENEEDGEASDDGNDHGGKPHNKRMKPSDLLKGIKGAPRKAHKHSRSLKQALLATLLYLWNFFCCCIPVEAIGAILAPVLRCSCCKGRRVGSRTGNSAAVTPASGQAMASAGGTTLTNKNAPTLSTPPKPKFKKPKYKSRTLYLFTDRHPLRRLCTYLSMQKWFDNLVLAAILISSLLLAVESPTLDPSSVVAQALDFFDYFFTIFFALEMAIKIISLGLFMPEHAYVKNGWNILDGVIVVVSMFSLFTQGNATFKGLKALRALRALRPLRVISRNPSLKLVVNALMRSMGPLINVVVVCSLLFLIFAIIMTSLFKGATYGCQGPVAVAFAADQQALLINPVSYDQLSVAQQSWGNCTNVQVDTSTSTTAPCTGFGPGIAVDVVPTSKDVCLWFGAQWQSTTVFSFDNVGESMATLAALMTIDSWVGALYATIDSRGIDMEPVRDNNPLIGLLWIIFILFCSLLSANLIVATIVDQFQRSRTELGDSFLLSSAQKTWVKTQELLFLMKPKRSKKPPTHPTRRQMFWIVTSSWFEKTILLFILLNTLCLAVPYFGMPYKFLNALHYINIAFCAVFTVECVAKIYAFGFTTYWEDSAWSKFDFIVVTVSDLGVLLEFVSTVDIGPIATVVRLLRIMRVLRLAHNMKSLRQMIGSLMLTLPSLANISALMFLALAVFGIAGVQLFGQVKHNGELDQVYNFENLGNAMLTLWRCLSGESWYSVMKACEIQEGCTHDPSWDDPYPRGCGNTLAAPFFYFFIFFVQFVVVQLLIAVVIESFESITDQDSQKLSREELEGFATVWAKLDPECTMFVGVAKLRTFLTMLPAPMGVGGTLESSPEELDALITSLRLPTYAGGRFVHFSDLALACARRVIAATVAERGESFADLPSSHGMSKRFEKLRGAVTTLTSDFTVEHFVAAETVWTSFRVFKLRRSLALAKGNDDEESGVVNDADEGGSEVPWDKDEKKPNTRAKLKASSNATATGVRPGSGASQADNLRSRRTRRASSAADSAAQPSRRENTGRPTSRSGAENATARKAAKAE